MAEPQLRLPSRIEDVVVVVHNDDIELFVLQLRSFEIFLESCNLHIVINEEDTALCQAGVESFLEVNVSKHRIKIWKRSDIITISNDVPGWTSQQLLKLLIPLKYDWIVFDSKDILIRQTQLIDLDKKQRKDYEDLSLKDPQGLFWQGLIELGKEQGFPNIDPKLINENRTPRVIDNRVIRKLNQIFKSKEKFIDWFCSFSVPGEFILHDYLYEVLEIDSKMRFPLGYMHAVWRQHIFDEIDFVDILDTVHIYKCHSRVYNVKENRKKINKWIEKVFKTYIIYKEAIKGK
tara:strand:+ start:205 stop:1074 length:870 start_codon:yes stop_codon:yes gene_type:complete